MSFLVVQNLDESDQFILGRYCIRNFDVTIDLNNAVFRIRNPERKYVIKPVNLIMANEKKAPVKHRNIQGGNQPQRSSWYLPSQSAAILGRSFSITRVASASASC